MRTDLRDAIDGPGLRERIDGLEKRLEKLEGDVRKPELIEIDPQAKYALVCPDTLTRAQAERLRETWDKFWAGPPGRTAVLEGGVKVIKVEGHGPAGQPYETTARKAPERRKASVRFKG